MILVVLHVSQYMHSCAGSNHNSKIEDQQVQAGVAMHHSARVPPSSLSDRNTQSDIPIILTPADLMHRVSKPAGDYYNRIQYSPVCKGYNNTYGHSSHIAVTMTACNSQQTSL
jgi:hypothetical protein